MSKYFKLSNSFCLLDTLRQFKKNLPYDYFAE